MSIALCQQILEKAVEDVSDYAYVPLLATETKLRGFRRILVNGMLMVICVARSVHVILALRMRVT
jgi:hypothetical protein